MQAGDVVVEQTTPPLGVEGCVVRLVSPYARAPLWPFVRPRDQRDRVGDTFARLDRLLLPTTRHLGHRVPGEVARGEPAVLRGRPSRTAETGEQDLGEDRGPVRALRLRRLQMAARLEHERATLALETPGLLPYAAAEPVPGGERAREAAVQQDHLLAGLGVVEHVPEDALDIERRGVQESRLGVDGAEEEGLPVVVLDAVAGVVEESEITGAPSAVELLDDLLHARCGQVDVGVDAVEVAVAVQHGPQLFDVLPDAGQRGELRGGVIGRRAEHQGMPTHQRECSIASRTRSISWVVSALVAWSMVSSTAPILRCARRPWLRLRKPTTRSTSACA